MAMDDDSRQAGFRKAFSLHGFGLQYAAAATISRYSSGFGQRLNFVGAEVPVSIGGKETHADLVFRDPRIRGYLLIECKKTDPAVSEWCFAPSGLSGPSPTEARPVLDQLHFPDVSGRPHLQAVTAHGPRECHQVGLSVKHPDKKGHGCDSDRDAIATTVAQALRAANGFIQLCRDNRDLISGALSDGAGRVNFLPVVLTTAALYCSDRPLNLSDATSGEAPQNMSFSRVPWLWYEHNLSSSMRAELPGRYVAEAWRDWGGYVRRVARRSVAIVGAEHVGTFLNEVEALHLE